MTEQSIPDIERAANTILAQAEISNPVLEGWVRLVASDPDYLTSFNDYRPDPDLETRPWFAPDLQYVTEDAQEAVFQHRPFGIRFDAVVRATWSATAQYGMDELVTLMARQYQAWRYDEAAMILAQDVVFFRQSGREGGDHTVSLGSGSGLAVTTSLAASVAEYVQRLNRHRVRGDGWFRADVLHALGEES